MEPHKIYYHPTTRHTHEDLLELLAARTFLNLSTKTWKQTRMLSGLPIYHNSFAPLRRSLLPSYAHELRTEQGAYVDPYLHWDNIIATYKTNDAFLLPTSPFPEWTWKFSWDNRFIAGYNEAWSLSPITVHHNQQPCHAHLLMCASIQERPIPMSRCVTESGMQDFLLHLDGSEDEWKDMDIINKLIMDGD